MEGARDTYTCPACGKAFHYWTLRATAQPKVVCSFCKKDFFPKGEPPAAPAPAPAQEPAKVAEPAK